MVNSIAESIEGLVLALHHRNGGRLSRVDWNYRLLDATLAIDSLDLAEIVVQIETQYKVSLFDTAPAPRTWGDVVRIVSERAPGGPPARVQKR